MAFNFCSLSSGSSGNCYLIGSNNTYILVDAGISAKKVTDSLATFSLQPKDISGILITHEHSDHIKGIDVLSKKYHLPIYTNEKTASQLPSICKYTEMMEFNIFENNQSFTIGELNIIPFPVFHDAADPVGFSISCGKYKICTATDTGCIDDNILKEISSADIVVLEANHDEDMLKMGRYPWFLKQRILSDQGHLSNEAAGKIIVKMIKENPKKRSLLLAHLSRENNFPEMAYQTIINVLESYNIFPGKNLKIDLLQRDGLSGVYSL